MALIDCPACGKKVSDKAKQCPHCDFAVSSADAEALLRKQKMRRYQKLSRIQYQSIFAILMFVTGFGFMFWGGASPGDQQHNIALGVCTAGFIWYSVNRVRLVILKRFSE